MVVRPIDANVAMKKIREYMEDFPNAHTRLTACRAILSMLGDENQMPTLTPPNEPLTLEQLREMDGEPVWVETGNQFSDWGKVDFNRRRIWPFGTAGEWWDFRYYGDWVPYAYPPRPHRPGGLDGRVDSRRVWA